MEPLTHLSDGALQLTITIHPNFLLHTVVTSSAWSHPLFHMGEGKVWVLPAEVLVWVRHCGSSVAAEAGPWLTAHIPGASLGVGGKVSVSLSRWVCICCSTTNSKLDSAAVRCPTLEQEDQAGQVHGDGGMWSACAMRMWVCMSFCSILSCKCPACLGQVLSFPRGWTWKGKGSAISHTLGRNPRSLGNEVGLQRSGRRKFWDRPAGGGGCH